MKGIVFNVLETLVVRDRGEDAWDELLDAAGVRGAYTSLGSYDDSELHALVGAAAGRWDTDPQDVIRWFGREAIPVFCERYPELFAPHDSTRAFVLTLNAIIHPEVRKLYPGAEVPEFDFDASDGELLGLGYRSPRKLCAFGEGLLEGTARHYGETARIDQPECMLRGDDRCLLTIRFDR